MAYYIYKHLDSNGNVIYCGKTKDIEKRQSEHLLNSKWKEEISKEDLNFLIWNEDLFLENIKIQ